MSVMRTYVYKKTHRSGNVTWVVRWKDPNTRSWISAAAGKTREEALLVEADIRKKIFRGECPKEKIEQRLEPKISELTELFYETPRFQNSTLDWQVVMRRQLQDVILPVFGKKCLSQVKREHLFRFYLDLKSKGLSHSTIGKYHQKFAMLDQLLREINPIAITEVPSSREFQKLFPKQPPTREINFLTPGELERIYKELQKCRSRLIPIFIRFLASTGMRRSEAIALKWEDVDFESGFIMIRRSKNGSVRKVPLEKETLEVLSKISGAHKQGFVFKNRQGEPFHKDGFLKPLKKAAKRAGILKRIDIHCLRHSWASNKIRQGWGLKKVSVILGHSDISMTSEVYAHLLDGDLKVSDDFRFDKEMGSANSNTVEEPNKSVAAIMSDLIHALNQLPTEALVNPEMAKSIQRMIQKELESSSSLQSVTTKLSQNDGSALQMLRGAQVDQNSGNRLKESGPSTSLRFQLREPAQQARTARAPALAGAQTYGSSQPNPEIKKAPELSFRSFFYGGPDRARTCDLQIRSLTL